MCGCIGKVSYYGCNNSSNSCKSIVKSHLHKICMWNACIDELNSVTAPVRIIADRASWARFFLCSKGKGIELWMNL